MKKLAILLSFLSLFAAAGFAACGEDETENTPAQEVCKHAFAENSLACTDRVCQICGEKVRATKDHSYTSSQIVEPTCTENGYTLHTCGCGATMKNSTVKKLGHDFGEYVENVEAACHTVGVQTAECSRCDEKDNKYVSALPHSLTLVEEAAPTCTESGYKKYHCSVCQEDIYTDYERATGHTSDKVHENTVTAGCEQDGYDEYFCSVCDTWYYENFVSATGHDWGETECNNCHTDIKALWLTEKGGGVSIRYTNGKGWKVTAPDKNDYDFAIDASELAKQIENGAKKLTVIFGGAFDGADFGAGNPVNCKLWVIPKNLQGEDVWDFDVRWISGFKDNGNGTYSVEIDLTRKGYLFSEGIYFHVSNLDVGGQFVGACYVHDIVFSK